ncbi:MAG: TonB family protein [Pseudomonadota bacterium]
MAVTQDNSLEAPQERKPADIIDLDAARNEAARAETVGQTLAKARAEAGLDLSEVVLATKIKQVHLEAIEASDMEALPAVPFTSGFIKVYATHLGLDAPALVNRFKDEVAERDRPTEAPASPAAAPSLGVTGETKLASLLGVGAIGLFALWMLFQVFKGPGDDTSLASAEDAPPSVIVTDAPSPSPQLSVPEPSASSEPSVSDIAVAGEGAAEESGAAEPAADAAVAEDFFDVFDPDAPAPAQVADALPLIEAGALDRTLAAPTLKQEILPPVEETVAAAETDAPAIAEPVAPATEDAATETTAATVTASVNDAVATPAPEAEPPATEFDIADIVDQPEPAQNDPAADSAVEAAAADEPVELAVVIPAEIVEPVATETTIDDLNRGQFAAVAQNSDPTTEQIAPAAGAAAESAPIALTPEPTAEPTSFAGDASPVADAVELAQAPQISDAVEQSAAIVPETAGAANALPRAASESQFTEAVEEAAPVVAELSVETTESLLEPGVAGRADPDETPATASDLFADESTEPGPATAAPASTPVTEAAPEPVVVKAKVTRRASLEYPSRCGRQAGDLESVTVIFDVLPEGRTANIGIKSTTNDCFNQAAMTSVRRMRFSASTVDGVPQIETGRLATLNFPK